MKNNLMKLLLSVLMVFVLLTGAISLSAAEEVSAKETLQPLMDLVSASALYSYDAPETVPGEEGTLSANFIQAFLLSGQSEGGELGITDAHLNDVEAQRVLLSSIFAAKLPELTSLEPLSEKLDFIGFYPVTEETLEDNTLRFMGEVYMADKPINKMGVDDLANIQWIERGLFTFQKDDTAMNSYRLQNFALGTDLAFEEEFRVYSEEIAVEYESNLGFMVLYPAVFADEILIESENGVTASAEDGKVQFSALRTKNDNKLTLAAYIEKLSANTPASTYTINDEMQYATVQYKNDKNCYVFDVISVTDEFVYTAELSCTEDMAKDYSMYFSYLENSFVIDELCQG